MKQKISWFLCCWLLLLFCHRGSTEERLYPMFFRAAPVLIPDKPKPVVIKKVQRKKTKSKKVRLNGCLRSEGQQAVWLDKKLLLTLPKKSRVVLNTAGECLLQRGEKKIEVGERFAR